MAEASFSFSLPGDVAAHYFGGGAGQYNAGLLELLVHEGSGANDRVVWYGCAFANDGAQTDPDVVADCN